MASNASFRSLLKSQKASTRLQHPYAHYSASGALSCSVCLVAVKHESLFASHLNSKTHRVKASQHEAQEAARKRAREEATAKSSALVEYGDEDDDEDAENGEPDAKRARLGGAPADFFDDPNQAPAPRTPTPEPDTVAPAAAPEQDDDEWLEFQREVIAPVETRQLPDHEDERFTISAAPVSYDVAGEVQADPAAAEEDEQPEETEAERRERLDREEYEEMMERLEEEEREQIEADERVEVLKRRLQAVRSAKATVSSTPASTEASTKPRGKLDLKAVRAAKRARGGA